MPWRQLPMASLFATASLLLAALAPIPPSQARLPPGHFNTTHTPTNTTHSHVYPVYDVFTLHSAANGQCLSYNPGSDGTSKKTTVSECQAFANEQCWFLGGPGARVKSTVNSYCLTVCQGDDCHDYRQRQMAEVIVVPCEEDDSPAQSWVSYDGRFMSEVNGDCLTQCTTCVDFVVVTYPCTGLSEQQWRQLPAAEAAAV
ncbi:unnamed protein product [Ostreobium quekettii]|uniref:Ricin B lectin domain-containing protein n=1 Tax=Ostreobium quekettii TaxID=121088 RepID=A0A8S1IVR5_9CHLO|nr:unnamed protein product [Ostreobium quekettii]